MNKMQKQAKTKTRNAVKSETSVRSAPTSEHSNTRLKEAELPALDILTIKVLSLQLFNDDPRQYVVKVIFFDQIITSAIIKPWIGRDPETNIRVRAMGSMSYDPSDYQKINLFANTPLIVYIKPLTENSATPGEGQSNTPLSHTTIGTSSAGLSQNVSTSVISTSVDINACNVDILPIFLEIDEMCVKKRLELTNVTSALGLKSWNTLPLLTLKLTVERNPQNAVHHDILKRVNYIRIMLIGAYNLPIPHRNGYQYLAATKLPQHNDSSFSVETFHRGYKKPKRFHPLRFYPVWESLRQSQELFNHIDEKFIQTFDGILNREKLDLRYMHSPNSTIWGSVHRTLIMPGVGEKWVYQQFRDWKWPFELHIYYENTLCYSFMAFLDLFQLLYPGERKVCVAVPLQWMIGSAMREACDCDLLMAPPATNTQAPKNTLPQTSSSESGYSIPTGAHASPSFLVIQVQLAKPLVKITMPPVIPEADIQHMLDEMEAHGRTKRDCTGRGQLLRDWQLTVRTAANALRKVPHYGMMEFCLFNRQLSETRTRVELSTSFWMDAAIYVNNNFNVKEFLASEEQYQEMLMMSHAILMKSTYDILIGVERWKNLNPILRSARHARHLQDIPHALENYLLLTTIRPYDADCWRELSTCLRDVDPTWANVCLDKAFLLDMRHPLNLLIKSCMVYEEDRDGAEPFFLALLGAYPFWPTAWVIASVYFLQRELFLMADQIMECLKLTSEQHLAHDLHLPRTWENELGDWWDSTPILPGMSCYYDAADLLLRIRCPELAEACLAQALSAEGEMAAYFHLVALSCRLQGKIDDAICVLNKGDAKYGDMNYLKSLLAECHHKNKNIDESVATFQKVINPSSAYSIMLGLPLDDDQRARSMIVDLVRRQPNAYGWLALAENWLMKAGVGCGGDGFITEEQNAAITCAVAYAIQALKYDRRAGRAWALLAQYVKPSARRLYCANMAMGCGYEFPDPQEKVETKSASGQSLCYRLGWALLECSCEMCCHLSL